MSREKNVIWFGQGGKMASKKPSFKVFLNLKTSEVQNLGF